MYCPKCGKELRDTAKFCGGCGTSVTPKQEEYVPYCSNCQKVVSAESKFCGDCGEPITQIPKNTQNNPESKKSGEYVGLKKVGYVYFCPTCQKIVSGRTEFCGSCGTAITQVPKHQKNTSTPKKASNFEVVLACVLVIIAVALLINVSFKCRNDCGKWADLDCSASMCDDCCARRKLLGGNNRCDGDHYNINELYGDWYSSYY